MNESQRQRLKLMAERFSEWLEAINYSPKTRVNYTRDVKLFLAWLSDNTAINSIVEVTPAHLQQYQIALYNFERHDDHKPATKEKAAAEPKRLSVGTQANRLAAVRGSDKVTGLFIPLCGRLVSGVEYDNHGDTENYFRYSYTSGPYKGVQISLAHVVGGGDEIYATTALAGAEFRECGLLTQTVVTKNAHGKPQLELATANAFNGLARLDSVKIDAHGCGADTRASRRNYRQGNRGLLLFR